jgi:hypothetical protein
MAIDIVQAYNQIKQLRQQNTTHVVLSRLLDHITCFEGKHGKGKSLSLVAVSYNMRELFGKHIVVVESSMGLKPAYGEYSFLSARKLVEQLKVISKASSNGVQDLTPDELDNVMRKQGVNLYNAIVIFDEANKLFEVGRWNDPLVLLVSYLVQQMAHYRMTILIGTPRRMDLTPRVREQVDYWARPVFDELEQVVRVGFYRLSEVKLMKLTIDAARYYEMYDRWNMLGFRGKSLNMKDEYL